MAPTHVGTKTMTEATLIVDIQYANWSEKIFRQMQDGGVDAVHVTIAYHENFREMVLTWNAGTAGSSSIPI